MKDHAYTVMIIVIIGMELRSVRSPARFINGNSMVKDSTVFGCATKQRGDDWLVNCSSRHLVFIPTLPTGATSVDLTHNQLAVIFNPTPFLGMTDLREIDLSDNPLQYVPRSIFHGLSSLKKLYMRNSLLYKQENLVLDTLLAGLINLEHFSFTFKLPENRRLSPLLCKYRHKTQPFGKVDSLQVVERLEIDSALLKWENNTATKGVTFRTKSLILINGIVCYYGQLTKKQFEYMPLLETIYIENPFLTASVKSDFVSSNSRLTNLGIYGPNAPYGQASALIYNVTESVSKLYNLTSLTLQGISDNIRLKFHCSELGVYNLKNLHSFTHLSLADNSLSLNEAEECNCFPSSLKHINLRSNCISNSEINFSVLFFNKQIESIDARDQSKCAFMAKEQTLMSLKTNEQHSPRSDIQYTAYNSYSLQRFVFTNSSAALNFGYSDDYYGNLTYLDLSLNNKILDATVPYFFSSSRPNIEYLDMSNCRISKLDKYSFSKFNKLQYLNLSVNSLGKMQCLLSDILFNLKSLKELIISNNNINCLTSYIFHLMKNLKRIDISNNAIKGFDASLAETKNLEYLDLSGNRINKLSENTMRELDKLAVTKVIKVDLSDNTILCTCDTLKFLRWMSVTKVDLLRREHYVCTHSNGSATSLKDLPGIVANLSNKCQNKIPLIVGISVIVACFLAFFSGILVYRFRWRIRYWYYKTKIKIPYQPRGHDYEQIYEYDLFVSYSSEDYTVAREGIINELENKLGFRACIHERDFKPGEAIAFNISRGIRSSRRTVLFISKSYLASEWCMYELNIARMEALHTGRKVILVILLENVPSGSMPVDILDIIDAYTYLEYPVNGTEADLDVFWSKCADFVSDS